MARAHGAQAQVVLAHETVFGTAPVTGYRMVPFAPIVFSILMALLHKSGGSSVIAEGHEQTEHIAIQDLELAILQRGAQASGIADDLVRSRRGLDCEADRQAWARQPVYSDATVQTQATRAGRPFATNPVARQKSRLNTQPPAHHPQLGDTPG